MTRSHVTTVDEPVARREFRSAPLSVSLCMFGSLRVCTLGSAVELARPVRRSLCVLGGLDVW